MKGMVIIYTGKGKGKTTASLGLCLRALGHGKTCHVVQFMKGWDWIGEVKMVDKLDNYSVKQFGREGWVDLVNPSDEDKQLAREGLDYARDKLKEKPDVLVLDEINYAVNSNMISAEEVLDVMKDRGETVLVLTGRNAPKAFLDKADLVTEMTMIKHPFRDGRDAIEGVEY